MTKFLKLSTLSIAAVFISFQAAFAAEPTFSNCEAAHIGIAVLDLESGEFLAKENYEQVTLPASLTKIVTVATALKMLGDDYRFSTDVYLDGVQEESSFFGKLSIESSWDPTIGSLNFDKPNRFQEEFLSNLNARGITDGIMSYEIVSTQFDQGQNPEWFISESGRGYSTGAYGFNYNDNRFSISLPDGNVKPSYPDIKVTVKNEDCDKLILRDFNRNSFLIKGREVETKRETLSMAMYRPADVFLYNFINEMRGRGFWEAVEETPEGEHTLLFTYHSQNLSSIGQYLMKNSDNLFAESVLRATAPDKPLNYALDREMELWKSCGVNPLGVKIYDGCGLSRRNRISPRFLTELLVYMTTDKYASEFIEMFPRVGREGTVADLFKKTRLDNQLALKTGSLNGVQCYAGYKLSKNGKPTHVIVIMVSDFTGARSQLKKDIEKYLLKIL